MPGHNYKGSRSSPALNSLWAAPLAVATGSEKVQLTLNSGNPHSWNLYESMDGGVTYSIVDTEAGSVHLLEGVNPGDLAYAQGIQSDGTPQTGKSNIVTLT
jgi:hypothetical protein